jgi:hypothetical protein
MWGFDGRGGLQRWPEGLGTWGHASRPSELAPIGGGCCLADCHSHAAEPPHRVPPRPSIRRHDQQLSQTAGGSASPRGEARREAPARRSAATAAPGRITGGGGRGGVDKPYHPTHPRPDPPTSAAARARRAKPGANAPPRRSEAPAAAGRITGGNGRAVKPNQTTQPVDSPAAQHPRPRPRQRQCQRQCQCRRPSAWP